ncbi:hypothetical protein PCL_00703 [Purpureocillium lilacinum]|uniref:Uncharacterized protein n=1 Tax=Purpureocillium lilacinum TaxID=33203 RepID=A0A2U3E5J1_PURLI|nr:hypothetical protein PCL_00703 [Purpureocillium lilacinum]
MEQHNVDNVEVPESFACCPRVCDEHSRFHAVFPQLGESATSARVMPSAPFLVAERIHPLPEPTREILIQAYCLADLQAGARASPVSKKCLARVHLGFASRRAVRRVFSLRKFKLYLADLVESEIDVEDLARRIKAIVSQATAFDHYVSETARSCPTSFDHYASDAEDGAFIGSDSPLDYHANEDPAITKSGSFFSTSTKQGQSLWIEKTRGAQRLERVAFVEAYMAKPHEVIENKGRGSEVLRLSRELIQGLIDSGTRSSAQEEREEREACYERNNCLDDFRHGRSDTWTKRSEPMTASTRFQPLLGNLRDTNSRHYQLARIRMGLSPRPAWPTQGPRLVDATKIEINGMPVSN